MVRLELQDSVFLLVNNLTSFKSTRFFDILRKNCPCLKHFFCITCRQTCITRPLININMIRTNAARWSRAILLVFLTLCFLASTTAICAQETSDSLKAEKYYESFQTNQKNKEFDEALKNGRRAALLFKKSKAWDRYVRTLSEIGFIYLIRKSQLESAQSYADKAIAIAEEHLLKSDTTLASAYMLQSACFSSSDQIPEAIIAAKKGIAILEQAYEPGAQQLGGIYNNLAVSYYRQKNHLDSAAFYFYKSIEPL